MEPVNINKGHGGMGLRDIRDFNKSMLSKIAWRLHNEEGSAWAKVMKGMYYPRGTLIEAKKGARPSWA